MQATTKANNQATGRSWFGVLLVICLLTLLPSLGTTLFNTKGEPREAVVAMSMLQSGDWILPISNGDVIPYKPPMLAWCIALFSSIGGEVTEFTSRLPSALSLIVLICLTYKFFATRIGHELAFTASLIMLTSVEVFRAGMACRVDMLLTLFIVGALYAGYRWWEREFEGVPWWFVVAMSGGVLTKGPVAVLLVCGILGVFYLLRGERFIGVLWRLAAVGAAALIVPALWYIAAYNHANGGEQFYNLVYEENIGRFTGTMSYDSHVKPFWYNFMTIAAGMLPYTLLMVMAMFTLRPSGAKMRSAAQSFWQSVRKGNPVIAFCITAPLLVLLFYCVPESKRSVYLLPMYPFMAVGVAIAIARMMDTHRCILKAYTAVIAFIAIGLLVAMVALQFGWVKPGNNPMLQGLTEPVGIIGWALLIFPVVVAMQMLKSVIHKNMMPEVLRSIIITVTIYWAYAGMLQPALLNPKSDRAVAEALATAQPEGTIYAYVDTPMLRYFTIDYYTGDRVAPIETLADDVTDGMLIVGDKDDEAFREKYGNKLTFNELHRFDHSSCDTRQNIIVYQFNRKQQ